MDATRGLGGQVCLIDEFYVHIDLMVCMLAPKCAAIRLYTTEPDVIDWLRLKQVELTESGFRDTITLECMWLRSAMAVCSQLPAAGLNAKLRTRGFEVYDAEMTMFTKAGDGVRCMSQPLKRLPG